VVSAAPCAAASFHHRAALGVILQHISPTGVHCTKGVLCIWMPLVCCTSLPLHCGGVVWPWSAARVYHFTAVYTSLRRCSLAAHLHHCRTLARVGVLQQVVVVVGNSTHGFSSLKIANLSSSTRGKCWCVEEQPTSASFTFPLLPLPHTTNPTISMAGLMRGRGRPVQRGEGGVCMCTGG
jgi:hypothetical protein